MVSLAIWFRFVFLIIEKKTINKMLFAFASIVRAETNYVDLNPTNFNETLSNNKCVLVRYYSFHQEASIRSHRDYTLVGKSFAESPDMFVAGFNCGKYRRECLNQNVYNLPAVKLFCDGKTDIYEGGFSYESINKWAGDIAKVIPKEQDVLVHHPNNRTFTLLKENNSCVFTMFHVPWCQACQRFMPRLNRIARLFKKEANVAFAEIDVDRYRTFLREFELQLYPDIRLFVRGEKTPLKYYGKRRPQQVVEYINQNCGTHVEVNDVEGELGLDDEGNTLAEEFFANGRAPIYIHRMKERPTLSLYAQIFEGIAANGDSWLSEESLRLKQASAEADVAPDLLEEYTKKINIISYIQELIENDSE